MDLVREEGRLQALHQLALLDTEPSERFDRITRMVTKLFDLPIAAVSLTDRDRQWFKSRVGMNYVSIPRDRSPCSQAAESCRPLVISDLLTDPHYRDSTLARNGIRFYAGAPLITREGFGLGSLCVLGLEPRSFTKDEMASLSDFASMVMEQIEMRHTVGRIEPSSGLPNRLQFLEDLEDLSRGPSAAAIRHVVLVDLASSEQLNDAARVMGPLFIEEMIKEAAKAMTSGSGASRTTYHVSQTTFAFLAPLGIDEVDYVAMLSRMLDGVRSSPLYRFVTTTVIGVAPFVLTQVTPADVLRIAFSAAQDARLSEGRVSVYSQAQDALQRRRFTLLSDFENALAAPDQLRLVYQPRIDMALGFCIGVEALLRWRHPTLGDVPPGEFIPIVEQTRLAQATTAWVLDAACRQLGMWRLHGVEIMLSVNVSAANLIEPDFVSLLSAKLARHGLPPASLELEITESAVMGNADRALATLEAIAATGVQLAIDDFGTGYSSLSYLQRLPVHVVKIDQSFMRGLADDERKRSLVAAMVSLSHDLGYRVVAEGIETAETLEIVKNSLCDEAQGYLFSRPLEPDALLAYLRTKPAFPVIPREKIATFSIKRTLAFKTQDRLPLSDPLDVDF